MKELALSQLMLFNLRVLILVSYNMGRKQGNKLAPSDGAFPARYIGEVRVKLRPLEFDFTRNGSYWKKKYFRLKEKMQELINNKDD